MRLRTGQQDTGGNDGSPRNEIPVRLCVMARAGLADAGRRRRPMPPAARTGRLARGGHAHRRGGLRRSEEHTSELQSLMRNSYAVLCLKKTTQSRGDTTATCLRLIRLEEAASNI